MTCFFMHVGEDCVTLMSDGACYQKDGTLTQVMGKQIIRPEIDMALAIMGEGALIMAIEVHMRVKSPRSFDKFTDMLPRVFEDAVHSVRQSKGFCEVSSILGGGFSASDNRLKGFYSHAENVEQVKYNAFDLLGPSVFARPDPKPEKARQYLGSDLKSTLAALGPEEFGWQWMNAVRESDMSDDENPVRCFVGGFVQHTTIGRGTGISTRIIHRWPDEIGELMDPSRDVY